MPQTAAQLQQHRSPVSPQGPMNGAHLVQIRVQGPQSFLTRRPNLI